MTEAVITGVWTTEKTRYYSFKAKSEKIHIVHITGTENYNPIFSTLCGKTFKDRNMRWRRSFRPVTCLGCLTAFEKIEPSVLDIVNFEIDLDAFGAVSPIPHPVVPRTCLTCGTVCVLWHGVIEDLPTVNCTIWWRNRRVAKLWDLKITTDHMRQLTCERLHEIYDYIRLGNPIGVPTQAKFLARLLVVVGEKSCEVPKE